jgi:flagellar biosynthesis protein FlhA
MRTGLTLAAIFRPTILLAVGLMAVIVMMILPIPAWMLDIGLALSFALAILMLTVTIFIDRPLDFSAFPTILLASLLLRLALNVSSTKLIIGQGHTGTDAAGHVIEGFAQFIMGGNLILGLVIFIVLLIVNFIVITKGAGRMAEVGARFALDGMPGRQLPSTPTCPPVQSTMPRRGDGVRWNWPRQTFSARSTGHRNSSRAMR